MRCKILLGLLIGVIVLFVAYIAVNYYNVQDAWICEKGE